MVELQNLTNQPTLPVKVLAIDGGGVRGIIPSHVLVALEELTGRSVASLFDVIVGTSIGGIGALALSAPNRHGQPDLTAQDVLDFFRNKAGQIFPQTSLSWPRSLPRVGEADSPSDADTSPFRIESRDRQCPILACRFGVSADRVAGGSGAQ